MSLSNMLQENKSLTHLDFSWNDLSDSSIFEGLQHNTTLLSLNLSNTSINAATDPDTARSLTKMLQENKLVWSAFVIYSRASLSL